MTRVRTFTVRFFLDAETGAVYEVRVRVKHRKNETVMWFDCTCEEFADEYWCGHADSAVDDFDDHGAFYLALRSEATEEAQALVRHITNDGDAEKLRDLIRCPSLRVPGKPNRQASRGAQPVVP